MPNQKYQIKLDAGKGYPYFKSAVKHEVWIATAPKYGDLFPNINTAYEECQKKTAYWKTTYNFWVVEYKDGDPSHNLNIKNKDGKIQ